MKKRLRASPLLAALLMLVASRAVAQETKPAPPKPSGSQSASGDKSKLPRGSILVVVDELKDLIKPESKLIVLTPEKYRELTSELEQLKAQLTREPKRPHTCKLVGKLEGEAFHFEAQFIFTTQEPGASIFLGLEGAHLTETGSLDGELPWLDFIEGGLIVKVDKAGLHHLKLNLRVPVAARRSSAGGGMERSVELGLPEAAVTTLAVELPASIHDLRWNDHVEKPAAPGRWDLAMGKIKSLKLAWRERTSRSGSHLIAESQVTVKLEDTQAVISAELALEDALGQAKEWHLFLPPQAKIELKTPVDLAYEVLRPDAKNQPFVLRLKEPTSERLQVIVESRHPRPFAPARLPVGPFFVVGALQQQGTIAVKAPVSALKGQRVLFHRGAETFQREIPPGAPAEALAYFHYWSQPDSTKPVSGKPAIKAPLELELKAQKGKVDGLVEHNIRVHRVVDGWQADVVSKVRIKSLGPGVDFVDVQLPRPKVEAMLFVLGLGATGFPGDLPLGTLVPGAAKAWPVVPPDFSADSEPGGPAVEPQTVDVFRRMRIKLSRAPEKEFTLVLSGKYSLPADAQHANLELPRLIDPLRAKVTVVLDDQFQLTGRFAETEEIIGEKHGYTTTWDPLPSSVDLLWRPFRREFVVHDVTDIFVSDDEARVRQELMLPTPPKSSGRGSVLRLRVPAEVKELVVTAGGKKHTYQPDAELFVLPPVTDTKMPTILEYHIAIPEEARSSAKQKPQPFQVPLVWLENATRIEATARIWTAPGSGPALVRPRRAEKGWREVQAKPLPGRDTLPALTVQHAGIEQPLTLQLRDVSSPLLAKAVFDHGLTQVILGEDGSHYYRSRFLVSKLHTKVLEVSVPLGATGLGISLDDVRVTNLSQVDDIDESVVKFSVDPFAPPTSIEIEYKLPGTTSNWRHTFRPAKYVGNIFVRQSRWHITHASGIVLVPLETNLRLDFEWGLRGWLIGPVPTDFRSLKDFESPNGQLAFWRNASPLQALVVPRQIWLLGCSGLLLAVGLGLSFISLGRLTIGALVVFVVLGLMAGSVIWPGGLPYVLYGCQPGAIVLVLVLAVQWLLQERYRRQVVFLPGFARLKGGSSLIRGKPGEATTVDAPAPLLAAGPPPGSQNKSRA